MDPVGTVSRPDRTRLILPDGRSYDGSMQYGEDGEPVYEWTTCGECGFTWNDALITGITPTPAGRCPNEAGHEERQGGGLRCKS